MSPTQPTLTYRLLAPVRYFKAICFWVGFSVILATIGAAFLLFVFFYNLPDVKRMGFEKLKTHAQKQVEMRYTTYKKHTWVPIDAINRDLIYTIVLAEDGSFFEHPGFDYDAIMNALFENVKADDIKYGASTISQQVSKNLFLDVEKSLVRKIKEYFITQRLEETLSKNEILELYLNVAEFGPEIFGVEHASRYYFNTTPHTVHAAQGAFMTLMLPSPRKYHYMLFQNKNFSPALKKKYTRILRDMRFKEYLSYKQYHSYLTYNPFVTH